MTMEYTVYAYIGEEDWCLYLNYKNEMISVTGTEHQSNTVRNNLQSMLEILQFLRNWVTEHASFKIFINSQ